MSPTTAAVDAHDLRKTYGNTHALDGIDLGIPAGGITGVLGPNGAGKTTLIRALTTLTPLDAGQAQVAGADVTTQPRLVRQRIGVTGQAAALDDALTGRDNLVIIGRLRGLGRRQAAARASELLEQFDLTQAGHRPVGGYSGGMRRRLDLACSLTIPPRVLFLDEPTTGLDPRSRIALWDAVKELAALDTTVVLTTQYLEEADQLAERIIVIDHGRVVADNTPERLKQRAGGVTLSIRPAGHIDTQRAVALASGLGLHAAVTDTGLLDITLSGGGPGALHALDALRGAGLDIDDFDIRRPTLDDVFFALTNPQAPRHADTTTETHP